MNKYSGDGSRPLGASNLAQKSRLTDCELRTTAPSRPPVRELLVGWNSQKRIWGGKTAPSWLFLYTSLTRLCPHQRATRSDPAPKTRALLLGSWRWDTWANYSNASSVQQQRSWTWRFSSIWDSSFSELWWSLQTRFPGIYPYNGYIHTHFCMQTTGKSSSDHRCFPSSLPARIF